MMSSYRHSLVLCALIVPCLAANTLAAPPAKLPPKDDDAILVRIASDRRRLEMKFTALQNEYQDLSARCSRARIELALMELEVKLADSSKDQRGLKKRFLISQKRLSILGRMLLVKEREVDTCLKSISSLTIKEKETVAEKTSSPKITAARAHTISITQSGSTRIGGVTVSKEAVHGKLAGLGAQQSDTIEIKTHPKAHYDSLDLLLHSLREAGYMRILITTSQ